MHHRCRNVNGHHEEAKPPWIRAAPSPLSESQAPCIMLAPRHRICFYSRMNKETSLPVRLEKEQRENLYRVSDEMGLTPSNIARLLVKSLIEHYDRNNSKIILPLEFKR